MPIALATFSLNTLQFCFYFCFTQFLKIGSHFPFHYVFFVFILFASRFTWHNFIIPLSATKNPHSVKTDVTSGSFVSPGLDAGADKDNLFIIYLIPNSD
jgi:hypothetical protein